MLGNLIGTPAIVPTASLSQKSQSRTAFCDGRCQDLGKYCHLHTVFARFSTTSISQALLKSSVVFIARDHFNIGKYLVLEPVSSHKSWSIWNKPKYIIKAHPLDSGHACLSYFLLKVAYIQKVCRGGASFSHCSQII